MLILKKWKLIVSLFVLFSIVVLLSLVLIVRTYLQPVNSSQTDTQRFVVAKGQSVTQIANNLQEAGLIRHPVVFRLVVRQQQIGNKIQAGSFDLSPAMNAQEIALALTKGTQDIWITILEGWRAEEIAEYLGNQELDAFDQVAFLELASESEGTLFPDTYLVPREITAQTMYSLLQNTFETKVTQGLADEIAAFEAETGYTFEEALIMASLVEREARNFEQMRHVAAILWNRMEIGMALQVDATLQYVAGYNTREESWWAPPSSADKTIDSAYNTYQQPGLPPQPIANPGLDAIRATLSPLEVDDLFYIHADDGSMYYAETLEQHNANINRYLR